MFTLLRKTALVNRKYTLGIMSLFGINTVTEELDMREKEDIVFEHRGH